VLVSKSLVDSDFSSIATLANAPTKQRIIFGLTSVISFHKQKTTAPKTLEIERTYLALFIKSSAESPSLTNSQLMISGSIDFKSYKRYLLFAIDLSLNEAILYSAGILLFPHSTNFSSVKSPSIIKVCFLTNYHKYPKINFLFPSTRSFPPVETIFNLNLAPLPTSMT